MPSSRGARALALAGSLTTVSGVAATGGLVTSRRRGWYETLDKPSWTPPDSAFGPVWSVLYAVQAVAAWLVWRAGDDRDTVDVPALSSYAVQLGLNLAWVLLFFGLRRPALALLDACVLWLAVATTARQFRRSHRVAAAMLLPYLAWVNYAAVLTWAVWRRNR